MRWFLPLLLLSIGLCSHAAQNQTSAKPPESASPRAPGILLLLDVQVDQSTVATALTAYQDGKTYFVPLGELASILAIGIQSHPETGKASGFVLRDDRNFDLDLEASRLIIAGQAVAFDASRVRRLPDDIYVDSALLESWWPVKLNFDLSLLRLTVQASEMLPLQLRLNRERQSESLGRQQNVRTDLPRLDSPYRLIDAPFVDQTFSYSASRGNGSSSSALNSSTFMSADLAGFEGAAYFNANLDDARAGEFRLALSRNDPTGQLLGPMAATRLAFGNVVTPGVSHVTRTQANGSGLFVSNAPLSRSTSFDTTSFTGSLQPGWDVELYFNDTLSGYQQSRSDGTYSFADQPLVFGENNYRLVFHGPQGQVRVENRTLMLDASILRPGQLLYNLGTQRDDAGKETVVTQFEYGLSKRLSLVTGVVSAPLASSGVQQRYYNTGLRAYLDSFILTSDYALSEQADGNLVSLGLNTRVRKVAVLANLVRLNHFVSDYYPAGLDPLELSAKLRLDGVWPLGKDTALPLTLQAQQDQLVSGAQNVYLSARTTAFMGGTAVTNELTGQSLAGARALLGSLQVSRNIAQISVRGQMAYSLEPASQVNSGSLATDFPLAGGYLLNLSASREFSTQSNSFNLNLNRSFSHYSLRAGINHSASGVSAGIQLFTSFGRDPRAKQWLFDVLPTANTGAVAGRVFVDYNQNGQFDAGDLPLKGVSLLVNNSHRPAMTDAEGFVYLNRLEPSRSANIELNTTTLEDSQWMPATPGVSIVPRPGRVVNLDFPVVVTTDIDGTVYLVTGSEKRGVGDVQLELVNAEGVVVAAARSSSDGYYLMPAVKPGAYQIRVSPVQTRKLNLQAVALQNVTIHPDGAFIKPFDFFLLPSATPP